MSPFIKLSTLIFLCISIMFFVYSAYDFYILKSISSNLKGSGLEGYIETASTIQLIGSFMTCWVFYVIYQMCLQIEKSSINKDKRLKELGLRK